MHAPILQPRLHPILAPQLPTNAPRDPITNRHIRHHGIHPAGTGEHTRIRDVQAVGAPDPSLGIDDPVSRADAHPITSHLMGAGKGADGGFITDSLDFFQPGEEPGVCVTWICFRFCGGRGIIGITDEGPEA